MLSWKLKIVSNATVEIQPFIDGKADIPPLPLENLNVQVNSVTDKNSNPCFYSSYPKRMGNCEVSLEGCVNHGYSWVSFKSNGRKEIVTLTTEGGERNELYERKIHVKTEKVQNKGKCESHNHNRLACRKRKCCNLHLSRSCKHLRRGCTVDSENRNENLGKRKVNCGNSVNVIGRQKIQNRSCDPLRICRGDYRDLKKLRKIFPARFFLSAFPRSPPKPAALAKRLELSDCLRNSPRPPFPCSRTLSAEPFAKCFHYPYQ